MSLVGIGFLQCQKDRKFIDIERALRIRSVTCHFQQQADTPYISTIQYAYVCILYIYIISYDMFLCFLQLIPLSTRFGSNQPSERVACGKQLPNAFKCLLQRYEKTRKVSSVTAFARATLKQPLVTPRTHRGQSPGWHPARPESVQGLFQFWLGDSDKTGILFSDSSTYPFGGGGLGEAKRAPGLRDEGAIATHLRRATAGDQSH